MRGVRLSEIFVPISDLEVEAAEWLRKLADSGAPVVVMQNGRRAFVVISTRAFDELTERACFVAAIEAGLEHSETGRVRSHASVVRRMKTRFGTNAK